MTNDEALALVGVTLTDGAVVVAAPPHAGADYPPRYFVTRRYAVSYPADVLDSLTSVAYVLEHLPAVSK